MAPDRWSNGSTRQWRNLRRVVLERDGYRCTNVIDGERCTASYDPETDTGEPLQVHHLDEGEALLVPRSRLKTMCEPCHQATFALEEVMV